MDAPPREVKVVVIGDMSVGKSNMVLRFVTNQFDKFSESTIGYVEMIAQCDNFIDFTNCSNSQCFFHVQGVAC